MSDRLSIREIVKWWISSDRVPGDTSPPGTVLIQRLEAREADEQSEVISYVVAKIKELTRERDEARDVARTLYRNMENPNEEQIIQELEAALSIPKWDLLP